MNNLKDNIQFLKGVGEKRALLFNKLGIYTVEQLLNHYPRKYTDYTRIYPLASAPYGESCVVKVQIYGIGSETRVSGGKKIVKVTAGDESAGLVITFFNNPYAVKKLEVNKTYLLHGKINGSLTRREVINPEFLPSDTKMLMSPIYPLTSGLTSAYISKCIANALAVYGDSIPEAIPLNWIEKYRMLPIKQAIRMIHQPKSTDEIKAARRRLIFDELLSLQLGMLMMKSHANTITCEKFTKFDTEVFYKALPFTPTNAQKKAVDELVADFKSGKAMNRLLQGDVGSGKTLVAAAGMIIAAQNGYQSVLMAPTEILAQQHAASLAKLLEPFNLEIVLLTGSVKGANKKNVLNSIKNGTANIIVGTHAVISDSTEFNNLGFAVTDEQHRFGVRQRSLLALKANTPHVLVMSATPIPRTLALLVFGELEISVLDELPAGRQPIKTYLVDSGKRKRMFNFIDKEIDKGRQGYIVCPLIEESENPNTADMQAVTTYYEEIAKPLLPNRRIALLHGKLSAKDKATIMNDFSKGEYDILCSTTVIEVGVDVPNSTVMVIENAERFGLSALHQLRGRVGRGRDESFCILVSDSKNDETMRRLRFLVSTVDGFEIARFDLENRGPGDFFGNRQHGLPQLKLADLISDSRILYVTQELAKEVVEKDPELVNDEYKNLKKLILNLFENQDVSFN